MKNEQELSIIQICSHVSTYFFKKYIEIIEHVIDEETDLTHQEVAKKMDDTLATESELKKCTVKLKG